MKVAAVRLFGVFRSRSRDGVFLRTTAISISSRVFSVLASFLTVPIVLHHVGRERYGIWVAAIALSTFFTLADGGVNKGLIAAVARENGNNDSPAIRRLVSTAMAITTALSISFILMAVVGSGFLDWTWLFNLSRPDLGREARWTVVAICVGYALSFPPTVVRETRLGLLQGPMVNLWDIGGQVFAFAGVILAVQLNLGLVAVAIAWSGGPFAARTTAAIAFLAGKGRAYRPSPAAVDLAVSRALIGAGLAFVAFNLAQMLTLQSEQLLIARILGATAVPDYSIVQRLFNQPLVIANIVLIALWPAYSDAIGRKDYIWVRAQLRRSLKWFTIISSALALFLAIFCRPIISVWVGPTVSASSLLIWSMAAYSVVNIVVNVFAFFFMSTGMLRHLVGVQILTAIISFPSAIFLISVLGPPGAAIASAMAYSVAFILPSLLLREKLLTQMQVKRDHTV